MCERLCCLSAPSDQRIVSLSGCLRVHIYISQTQINLSPASHQHCTTISSQPVAISLLRAGWDPACYHHISFSRATAFGSISPHSTMTAVITIPSPMHTLSVQRHSLSPCLPVNHHPLCFSMAQFQDPANQKTWLMELSLLLTTWAPLSCYLRGTPPRTYAWCRPRKLSAGSRYSKSHWLILIYCLVFDLKISISILLNQQATFFRYALSPRGIARI